METLYTIPEIPGDCRANFEHKYPLEQFAALLDTTEAKLNDQAKRLLTDRKLSMKEVAYQLGLNDAFYFSSFFKKHATSLLNLIKTCMLIMRE